MIRMLNVCKAKSDGKDIKMVLNRACATFPPLSRTAIFGSIHSGKPTLGQILQKLEIPDYGTVEFAARLSPVLGNSRGVNPYLSGAENVQILARLLCTDPTETLTFVDQFAELGAELYLPVGQYSAAKRAQLSYALSYATRFQFYLADETTGAGDFAFKQKCEAMLVKRLESGGLILLCSQANIAAKYCDRFYALALGRLVRCATCSEALHLSQTSFESNHDRH